MILYLGFSNVIIRRENWPNAFMVVECVCYSMTPIVHFVISIFIAFCLGIATSRKYTTILLLGIVGMIPDIDHFFPKVNGFGLFHNTFFMGVLPLALFMFAHLAENDKIPDSSVYQRFFLGATIVLLGHLLLDLIAGHAIQLGLFFGSGVIIIPNTALIESQNLGILFSAADLLWLCLFAMVITGNYAIAKIYGLYEGWVDVAGMAGFDRPAHIPSRKDVFPDKLTYADQ